jgi:hypothetical protein
MFRLTSAALAGLALAACQPAPKPDAAPAAGEPGGPSAAADSAPAAAEGAWASDVGPDQTSIATEYFGNKVKVTCLGPQKTIRVDVALSQGAAGVPANATGSVKAGDLLSAKELQAPATASTEPGYAWSASFPADADLITGFMTGPMLQVVITYPSPDGRVSSNGTSFDVGDSASNQFGTDCAQITGQRGG